ncbi:MAG: hypothetical protein DRI88_11225 [Bacteroidetes bacterium]|nr:MAG: hypothetical protein DRI88_11225 [Bacteroidota bacterium]
MRTTIRHITLKVLFIIVLMSSSLAFFGQTAFVSGTVTDDQGKPVELANVSVIGEKKGTSTNAKGKFRLEVPADKEVVIGISFIGYANNRDTLKLKDGQEVVMKFQMKPITTDLPGFEVKDERLRTENMVNHMSLAVPLP